MVKPRRSRKEPGHFLIPAGATQHLAKIKGGFQFKGLLELEDPLITPGAKELQSPLRRSQADTINVFQQTLGVRCVGTKVSRLSLAADCL